MANCHSKIIHSTQLQKLPDGFVYVSDFVSNMILDIRYYSANNFVGARIDGYSAPAAILSEEAASALMTAGKEFNSLGYAIKVYDAYRPQIAIEHFIRWAKDIDDVKMKSFYYPELNKSQLFKLGYISEKSAHTRGSCVDLTIVNMSSGKDIDMGSSFDYFGEISHHGTSAITQEQTNNRNILKGVMAANGFEAFHREWWHYTLADEPYADTYFTFPVN